MAYGDHNGNAKVCDEPTLGAHVELIEGTVGDALALIELNGKVPNLELGFHALAVSLRVDGRRFTVDELKQLPGSTMPALLRLSSDAIALNNFFPAVTPEGDETEPKS